MAKSKRNAKEPLPEYKVGDCVSFPFGSGWVTGKVVEDRGCLGIGGRRLYGIKFEINPGEQAYVEAAADELTAGATTTPRTATNDHRRQALENGTSVATPPGDLNQVLKLARKLSAAERGALLARLSANYRPGNSSSCWRGCWSDSRRTAYAPCWRN